MLMFIWCLTIKVLSLYTVKNIINVYYAKLKTCLIFAIVNVESETMNVNSFTRQA